MRHRQYRRRHFDAWQRSAADRRGVFENFQLQIRVVADFVLNCVRALEQFVGFHRERAERGDVLLGRPAQVRVERGGESAERQFSDTRRPRERVLPDRFDVLGFSQNDPRLGTAQELIAAAEITDLQNQLLIWFCKSVISASTCLKSLTCRMVLFSRMRES